MKQKDDNIWALIPARGGSKGIPRKNLRLLAGKPLLLYVLDELSKILPWEHIIVSTDDEEIAQVSQLYATIHHRSPLSALDKATLDDVAIEVAQWLVDNGANPKDYLITIQPTSPFIKAKTLLDSVKLLQKGAKSVLSVKDDRHLRWTLNENNLPQPLFTARANRQWLPPTLAETGGIIGARIGDILKLRTRIVEPIALIQVNKQEGLDIDSYADWAIAEYYLRRKKIMIRVDAKPELGMGHVYRAIAIAHELAEHEISLVTRTDGDYILGVNFLNQYPYKVETIEAEDEFFVKLDNVHPDIVFLDVLDTNRVYVEHIREYTKNIVSLEDLGTGAQLADVVINDLYTDLYPQHNHWYGVEYAILNPQFETITPKPNLSSEVKNILIAFGGTDPQNLTIKALAALQQINYTQQVTVVLGPGYSHGNINLSTFKLSGEVLYAVKNMSVVMREADIAITSAGRTVTELMTLGVPSIVMCQNIKEMRHTHASSPFGVINLGLGEHVEMSTLAQHISMLSSNYDLRLDMHKRALNATSKRSNKRIIQDILQVVLPEKTQ